MPLLLTAGTRKGIAGIVTYINEMLSTCTTIVFLGCCEQPEIHNFIHERVYFGDHALVFEIFLKEKQANKCVFLSF